MVTVSECRPGLPESQWSFRQTPAATREDRPNRPGRRPPLPRRPLRLLPGGHVGDARRPDARAARGGAARFGAVQAPPEREGGALGRHHRDRRRDPATGLPHARRRAANPARLLRDLRPELFVPRGARLRAAGRLQHPHPAPPRRRAHQRQHLRRGLRRPRVRARSRPDPAGGDLPRPRRVGLRKQRLLRGHQRHHQARTRPRRRDGVGGRRELRHLRGQGDLRPPAGERARVRRFRSVPGQRGPDPVLPRVRRDERRGRAGRRWRARGQGLRVRRLPGLQRGGGLLQPPQEHPHRAFRHHLRRHPGPHPRRAAPGVGGLPGRRSGSASISPLG